jgi:hypothetical protein
MTRSPLPVVLPEPFRDQPQTRPGGSFGTGMVKRLNDVPEHVPVNNAAMSRSPGLLRVNPPWRGVNS